MVSAACSSADDDGAGSTSISAASATVGAAAPTALAFSAPTVGGGTLDMGTYAGKTVAIWFWAPY